MKVLLRNVITPSHLSPTDILIENGIIAAVENNISSGADRVIEKNNLHVSSGWVDCFSDFCDPGFEQREILATGAAAAAAGGYTDVMLIPNTQPVLHTKSQVEYIIRQGRELGVNLHPIGAVTKNAQGEELSEMYDMHHSGAIAFSDGTHTIQSSGIVLKALEYIKAINGTLIQLPDDRSIAARGLVNEGVISMRMGLPGRPAIAEELLVARDIELAKYTASKIHFTGVSTKRGLECIARAKADGHTVSCSVTPYHLYFNDEDLEGYDTNLKVNPPLRTREDMLALRHGIKDGIVDCIASHHLPQHWDDKTCEFEYAQYGMTGLESVFGVVRTCGISEEDFLRMNENAKKIFGLPKTSVTIGSRASLTLYDPDLEYVFDESHIRSRSRNNPFTGRTLTGKSFGIINGDRLFLPDTL